MDNQQTSLESSLGCGLLGCAGDMILGFLGGGVLLIVLSLAVAVLSPDPALPASAGFSDLQLTVREDFLNRFVQTSAAGNVRVDILPGGQFNLIFDSSVTLSGVSVPVQITGLFEIQLNGQTVELRLLDTAISGVTLPVELTGFFDDSLSEVNEELDIALNDISTTLGVPLILVNLGSDDATFWLEASEAR
ncbi:MAG: hypothetical protein JXM69_02315 [Anaerolineae bacterium]|nr:hypothetical protein [Anaerolineae bacterium]